jgi:hypothetical protein
MSLIERNTPETPLIYLNIHNVKESPLIMELASPDNPNLKWLYQTRNYNRCPICKIGLLDKRVPRDPFVKYVLFFKDVKRYRCNNCYSKVYIKKTTKK